MWRRFLAYFLLTLSFSTCSFSFGQSAARTTTFRFRFVPDTLQPQCIRHAELLQCALEAGKAWGFAANVAIVEALPAQATSWRIRQYPKASVWGTYSGGLITISNTRANVLYWCGLSPKMRHAFFVSLLYHEMWHAMGGHGNHTPAYMRSWLAARYGPPLKRVAGDGVVIAPLPPVPEAINGTSVGRCVTNLRLLVNSRRADVQRPLGIAATRVRGTACQRPLLRAFRFRARPALLR